MCVCTCLYVHVPVYVCVCVCMCLRMYVCIFVCELNITSNQSLSITSKSSRGKSDRLMPITVRFTSRHARNIVAYDVMGDQHGTAANCQVMLCILN